MMKNVTLDEISLIKGEYGGNFSAVDYFDDAPRYVRITDINDEGGLNEVVKAPSGIKTEWEKYILKKGDLLFARTGATVGKTFLYNESFGNCIYAGYLIRFRLNDKVTFPKYIYYFTKTPEYFSWVFLKQNIVAQPNINAKQYGQDLQIPLPPLDVQQKIASILDAADTLRQKDKALLAKYDELTKALFLDMFGDPVNNQKQLKTRSFGSIFKSIRYGTSTPPIYTNNGIPFIRATNVKKGTVALKGMVYISEEEAGKIEKCRIKEGDLIVVRSGANTGDCCRIPKEYDGCYGGFDLIIEIEEPYSTFYNFLLNSESGKKILEPLTRRAGQPHLNSKQMTELELIFPDPSYQTQFAERVAIIEQQKAQAQASLEKSEELFNSLLQKAFNGELIES